MRIAMLLHKSVEFDSRVRREASALEAAGHEVVILELAPVPAEARVLDGFCRRSVLPSPWVRRALPFHLYRLAFLLSFVRGVLKVRPDVVHAHDAAMLLPGMVGARLTRSLLVYDSHELATGVPYRERAWAWFVGVLERFIVPRCDAVITVSDGIADRLRARYRLPVTPTVLRNVSALAPGGSGGLRTRLGLTGAEAVVLHQGAPAPSRGCDVLVRAVAGIDGVRLVFLGDPEPGYGEQLHVLIDELGLVNRVSVLPSVPLDELLGYTADADLGVTLLQDTCENHRLALPNKLFEYIAAGVPVLAAALPETERLVREYGIGWCVRPNDPAAVANGIRQALSERGDPGRRARLAAAAAELSWQREQVRLTSLYKRLQTGSLRTARGGSRPLVLLLVRNAVSHDARVLRAARTAAAAIGGESLVVGVATAETGTGADEVDGVAVVRLPVRAGPRLVRRTLARPGHGAETRKAAAPAPPAPETPAAAIGRLTTRARLRRTAAGVTFAIRATMLARRLRPAIVHANDWNTMWAGIAIKLACGARLVYDSHELWADRNGRWETRPWLLLSEAVFMRAADEVITTSPGYARELATRYRVVEPALVRNIPARDGAGPGPQLEPPVIAYVGGLMRGRGLEQMIDALALIPGVALRAIGPGAAGYRAALRERAAALAVDGRLELLEPVPPAAVQAMLAGATAGLCLIQPICRSYELSLPNKLFEYAAAGLPVLASDLPVISSVVRAAGMGVVVPATDPPAIASGVRLLLDPATHASAAAAARRFAATSTWEQEAEVLAGVYRALIRPD